MWNNGKATYTYTYDDKGNITSISDGGQEFDYQYERMTVLKNQKQILGVLSPARFMPPR